MTLREDTIRDVQHAAERLIAVRPTVREFVLQDGSRVAALVLAEGPPCDTSDKALAQLAVHVAGMVVSNIDHDKVFEDRLKDYRRQLAPPDPE